MKKFECKYCGKKFESGQGLGGHTTWCKKNPTAGGSSNWCKRAPQTRVICDICGQEFSSLGIRSHAWRMHEEGRSFDPNAGYKDGSRKSWNKGLTKETSESVRKISQTLIEGRASGRITFVMSDAAKQRLSKRAKESGFGGYRPHPNRGEKYKGIWFDSKWEVRLAKSLDENQIKWERPRVGFVWTDTGRKYYPDFFLTEHDIYLDPKNPYLQKKDKLKIEEAQRRNQIRVLVLNENQLTWDAVQILL